MLSVDGQRRDGSKHSLGKIVKNKGKKELKPIQEKNLKATKKTINMNAEGHKEHRMQ